MPVIFVLSAVGASICIWMAVVIPRPFTEPTVWTDLVSKAISPDGAWKAYVDQTVYEADFMTVITDRVHLSTVGAPTEVFDILEVDTGGHDYKKPRIAWVGPDILRITADNLSYIDRGAMIFQTAADFRLRDVIVQLRFDPDDPAARAAWLKEKCARAICGQADR